MEDQNSVYVGGLSYETTEDALREKFEPFGSIRNVKIIVDRNSGNSRGYGFVTFTNSRAATKAINGMDGGTLGGRIIKVNDVTKNGRSFRNDHNLRDRGRLRDSRDFRFRDRIGNARQPSPSRNRRASPGAFNSDRSRLQHHRSRSPQGGYSPTRSLSPVGKRDNHSSVSPSPRSSERNLQVGDATSEKVVKAALQRDEDLIKLRSELERSSQRRDELRLKVSGLENENLSKEKQIIELQNKFQRLEQALSAATAATDEKQNQLRKLQRAYLQVRSFTEGLQRSEKELQAIMNSLASQMHGSSCANEIHGNAGLGFEDMEAKDDDGHINIDD